MKKRDLIILYFNFDSRNYYFVLISENHTHMQIVLIAQQSFVAESKNRSFSKMIISPIF